MSALHGLILFGVLLQGLDANGRHTVPLKDHIRLTLTADGAPYYRGEPLRLRATALNTSHIPVTSMFPGLDPVAFTQATLFVRRGRASAFQKVDLHPRPSTSSPYPAMTDCKRGPEPKTIHPGQRYEDDFFIPFLVENGARRFMLNDVGRYEFKLRYDPTYEDPNGILESNALVVHVVEPPAAERAAVAAYTVELAGIAWDSLGWSLTEEQTRKAVAFIQRFRSSRLSPPLRDSLYNSLEFGRPVAYPATEEQMRLYRELVAGEDRTPPPDLGVYPSLAALWPPDNAMVRIAVYGGVRAADPMGMEDPSIPITLESITCDDSCDLESDVAGAEVGADDREFELRANRGRSGVGRTYTVTYSATNAAGKRDTSVFTVKVPPYETPPEWSPNNVLYLRGEPVMHAGQRWRAGSSHRSDPRLAPSLMADYNPFWLKERKGTEWDFPLQYDAGDEVVHQGVKYKCLRRHRSTHRLSPHASEVAGLWEEVR
jgi:hypothetical protein